MIASTTLDLAVVLADAALAAAAAVVMLLAAFGESMPELRPVRFAGAVLAGIYFGAYLWLAFNLPWSGAWSQYLRPVGLLSWTIVWVAPTLIEIRTWRKIARAIGHAEGRR